MIRARFLATAALALLPLFAAAPAMAGSTPTTEPCHGPLDVSNAKACCPTAAVAYHECPSGTPPVSATVTPSGPTLAHTGASSTAPLTVAAGLLVLSGAIAIVGGMRMRRRAGTHQ